MTTAGAVVAKRAEELRGVLKAYGDPTRLVSIVDGYYALSGARQAIIEYRLQNGISEPIEQIDWTGAFWRRKT